MIEGAETEPRIGENARSVAERDVPKLKRNVWFVRCVGSRPPKSTIVRSVSAHMPDAALGVKTEPPSGKDFHSSDSVYINVVMKDIKC